MIIELQNKDGITKKTATIQDLKNFAVAGNINALKELIELKGGYDSLTAIQKDKVVKILLGYSEEL